MRAWDDLGEEQEGLGPCPRFRTAALDVPAEADAAPPPATGLRRAARRIIADWVRAIIYYRYGYGGPRTP